MTTNKRALHLIILCALMLTAPAQGSSGKIDAGSCSFNGIRLSGKVQVVNAFADLKVEVVNAFADLKVQVVNAFPDKCGQWEYVNAFPDFKVQFVNAFGDIKVQFVNAFPGVN